MPTVQTRANKTTATSIDFIPKPARVDSIDLLRGIVMIVMALDHSRDFFTNRFFNPEDIALSYPSLFFTRVITHICAPTFMLLAGTGGFLSLSRGKTKAEVAKFFLTRGIAFVIAEQTILRFGWESIYGFHLLPVVGGTLWGLGWAMIAMSGFVWISTRWTIVIASAIVLFHNAFDGFTAESWGSWRWVWVFLHGGNIGTPEQPIFFNGYAIIPWAGVMALGYAMGHVVKWEKPRRIRFFFTTGLCMTVAFVVLHWTNLYGDHNHWSHQKSAIYTVMSFMTEEKYPPSLLYLLMTLGPMLMLLAGLENWKGRIASWVLVYGRVPLFYYFAHIYLLHVMALALSALLHKPLPWTAMWAFQGPPVANYGFGLPVVYAAWIAAVVALYPACKWYMGLKRRSKFWLLGYL